MEPENLILSGMHRTKWTVIHGKLEKRRGLLLLVIMRSGLSADRRDLLHKIMSLCINHRPIRVFSYVIEDMYANTYGNYPYVCQ